MKRSLLVLTLTCVLSVSAMAADIPTVGITSTEPDTTVETVSPGEMPTVPGDMPTVDQFLLTVLGLVF
jgi:hypothetical protein